MHILPITPTLFRNNAQNKEKCNKRLRSRRPPRTALAVMLTFAYRLHSFRTCSTRSHLPCEAAHLSREARGCGCGPSLKHPTTSLLWVWGHSKYDCLSVTTVDKRSIRIPSQSLRRMLLTENQLGQRVILTYCLIHAFYFCFLYLYFKSAGWAWKNVQHFDCLSNSRLIFVSILNLLDEHGISV